MFRKKTRSELMRAELGTSWDHLMQAATHAAGGIGQSVGPRAQRMSGAAKNGWSSTMSAFGPLSEAYKAGVADAAKVKGKLKKASKKKGNGQMSRKKVGVLIGLLAAGAAIGAAGALVMKRRKQQQWSEYDPSSALESVRSDARSLMEDVKPKSSTMDKTLDKASSTASKAMHKAGDKLHSAASNLDGKKVAPLDEAAERINDATDDLVSKASNANNRFKP